ncbi:MAG: bifunctional riboflavin kinase/FAD synthetase [Candidatus Margulisiibacteriota bacterium]
MKGSVIALGTFDGVHLGHQRILKDAASYAKRAGFKSIAITFDPHPQQFIVPERGLKLLTTIKEREELLSAIGMDKVKVINFNKKLQKLTDEQFVKKYLVNKLKAAVIFAGYDFAFGRGRSGKVSDLRRLGAEFGFKVRMVRPVKVNNSVIKSSLIREMVSRGNFNRAVRLLGHPYRITGKVVPGAGRGRDLGIPTANLKADEHKLIPQHGVYIGKVGKKKCVVNIGSRPTFGADGAAIEAHLPGFSGDLYGKTLKLDLYRKIRDEIQFSDVQKLKARILKDIAIARRTMV